MSSSAKQQASRREELRLTAQERLDTDPGNRILFLLTQIDDSMDEIGRLFPDYARKTIIAFTEITGTKGAHRPARPRSGLRERQPVHVHARPARTGRDMAMTSRDTLLAALWLLALATAAAMTLWAGMWLMAGLLRAGTLSVLHLTAFILGGGVGTLLWAPFDDREEQR